jgi:hypothetical protein
MSVVIRLDALSVQAEVEVSDSGRHLADRLHEPLVELAIFEHEDATVVRAHSQVVAIIVELEVFDPLVLQLPVAFLLGVLDQAVRDFFPIQGFLTEGPHSKKTAECAYCNIFALFAHSYTPALGLRIDGVSRPISVLFSVFALTFHFPFSTIDIGLQGDPFFLLFGLHSRSAWFHRH